MGRINNNRRRISKEKFNIDGGSVCLVRGQGNNSKLMTLDKADIPPYFHHDFVRTISPNISAFAHHNRSLVFNTNVEATIQTATDESIYDRL